MDPETWPDILIAVLASSLLVGVPGALIAIALVG